MKKFIAVLIAALGFSAVERAGAEVLSFDEINPSGNPTRTSLVCGETNGFQFRSDHFHVVGTVTDTGFSSNGTTHVGYESARGLPITMTRVGNGTFSLQSLDVGEFWAGSVPAHPDAETVVLTGFKQGGQTVTHTLTLDGIHDGVGGAVDFQHFVLPATFVDLTSVIFTGLRSGGQEGGLAVDNLQYQLEIAGPVGACVLVPETPSVAFTAPLPGTVTGTVQLQATATDNVGVLGVQYKLDDVPLGSEVATAPYSLAWDTTTVADGPHTLVAEARDVGGNVGTASMVVTVRNAPLVVPAYYVELSGGNDHLQVADAASLSFGDGTSDRPLTIEAWFRPDTMTGKQNLVSKWWEGSVREYRLYLVPGALRLDLRDGSAGVTVSAITNNQAALAGGWHHVAVTYDGRGGVTAANGITIYIDGVSVPLTRQNNASYVAMENWTAPLELGCEIAGFQPFNGGLDEVRLWNVVRTQSQVQATMLSELTGTEPGLVAYWRFNEGAGTTVADDSPGNHTATLYNTATWMGGGPFGTSGGDVTPPDITGVTTSNLTTSSVTISFGTSEAATGWVSFTGASCPCSDVYSAGSGTAHVVTLTGLTADTTYQYQVKATDGAGNLRVGPTLSVRTLASAGDTTPPVVEIANIVSGTVAGSLLVQATATDNVGVVGVQFKVDGMNLGSEVTVAPYSVIWDTTTVADGSHALTAEARDAANNVGTASLQVVTVRNAPPTTVPRYIELNGGNDHLQVADADSLSFGNGTTDRPLTIELWFRPDVMTGKQNLVSKWWEGSVREYRLYAVPGALRLDLRDSSAGVTVSAVTNNQAALAGGWHHLAVTYDGRGGASAANGITFYIDGIAVPIVERNNNAAYVAMENRTAALELGCEIAGFQPFNGGLDEVRLWDVVRTQSQVQAAMLLDLTGTEPGLAAYWRFNEGTGTTVADDSPNNHTATLYNAVTWMDGGPLAPSGVDVTPPDITGVTTSNLTTSSVTISFATSEVATGRVSYTGASCPCSDVYSAGTGTSHVVVLTGLAADTTYQYQVKAADGSGNLRVGPTLSVRTLAPAGDTTPPVVGITSPAAGTVAGTLNMLATATDNVGVVGVQFMVDGVSLGSEIATAPYGVTWDTTTVTDGPHTIAVVARDAASNTATTSVVVTVRNTPTTTIPRYIELNAGNDHVQVADADSLSFGNGTADRPLTIETWFRPDVMSGKQNLVSKWWEGSVREYRFYTVPGGALRLDLRDGSAGVTVSAVTSGQSGLVGGWHHLAVTYDGRGGASAANGITFYVDGVVVPIAERNNNASYVAMENWTAPLEMGCEIVGFQPFNGGLDDVRLWSVVRTPAQVQASRLSELTGTEPGLAAYWRFNEGSGTTVADDSPNNHTATLFNTVTWMSGGPVAP